METRSNHVLVGTVVLILLAVLALFTVWIARLGGTSEKEYDIFFRQSVDGLAKGSAVTYSGVPSGQVKEIALWRPDPQYVRVRVAVNEQTPILQGTTASISASFTGTSTVALDGARKGAQPIACPEENRRQLCPYDVPVIPTKQGGIGFSFLTIILGAVAMGAKGKIPGILLMLCAIAGAVLGGMLVAVCMVLALIGGLLAAIGTKKAIVAVA